MPIPRPCGFCLGFGCEVGAKSTSLSSVIPMAEKTGRCEIRPNCYVHRIETDKNGRAIGALYFDGQRNAHLQKAKAVILSANDAESSKRRGVSASNQFPAG